MSAARVERLLNLLTLLLNARRPISLREIREMDEFVAYQTADPRSGERGFERDKAALLELGVPLRWIPPEQEEESDTELGGYIIDRERYYLPELNLDPSEVALLSIAGAAAVAMEQFPGRAAVIRALAKLGFDVDESTPAATFAHSPVQAGFNAERTGKNLDVLHDAVARRRRVCLTYVGAAGGRSEREVDPWGLYYRHGVWYLVGHCHLRDGERTFHLGRMEEVKAVKSGTNAGSSAFDVPDSFDLSDHARRRPWEFPNEPTVEVKIRLAERLVPAIGEIFGSRAVVETKAGAAERIVRINVTHRAALIAAVLPYGAAAEVIEPADLRARIGDIYAELAERYAGEDSAP